MDKYVDVGTFITGLSILGDKMSENGKVVIDQVIEMLNDFEPANVVERKDTIIEKEKCTYHFADIDGYTCIVFSLNNAFNDVTNIRICLDKYNLRKVVHGEWKHTITYYPYCSECGWMPEEDEMLHTKDFCPNCGADMRGDIH